MNTSAESSSFRRERLLLIVMSLLVLFTMYAARIVSPTDAWDQTQPKTLSYTTDIVLYGRWALPMERGTEFATKPPLYNWVAAPFVRWLGFDSEIAHRMPSILAMLACWMILLLLSRRVFSRDGLTIGWIAGAMFVSGYTMYKLGYLARPDMLLTVWLILAWLAATKLVVETRASTRTRLLSLGFWICVGLAGLTKGLPAIVPIVYVIVAARFIGGSWTQLHRTHWWWGFPLTLSMIGIWLVLCYRQEPGHVINTFWHDEIYGRITGTGPEGSRDGPKALIRGVLNHPLYYLARSAPWSVISILAVSRYFGRDGEGRLHRGQMSDAERLWLPAMMLYIVVTLVVFSFSAHKRSDYIAAAYIPGAILAAWWCVRQSEAVRHWSIRLVPVIALVLIAVMTWDHWREDPAPAPGFGREVERFVREARSAMDANPLAVRFWNTGVLHWQAYLGASEAESDERILEQLARGEPFWVVAGVPEDGEPELDTWMATNHPDVLVTPVVVTKTFPRERSWVERLTLYRIQPQLQPQPPRTRGAAD